MNLLLKITLALLLTGCACRPDARTFTVEGKIKNVKDSCIILLFKNADDGTGTGKTIAVDTLINGKFKFTAEAEEGTQYHICAVAERLFSSMPVNFYVEPGATVRIFGDDYMPGCWKVKSKVRNQKIYQSCVDRTFDVLKAYQKYELDCHRQGTSVSLPTLRSYSAKVDSIHRIWLRDQKTISEPWLDIMQESSERARIFRDKDAQKELKATWDNISDEVKESKKGKIISQDLYPYGEPLTIGSAFPMDTEAYDMNSQVRTFNEFLGKPMLIYFGSYGCKPCVAAKKELKELMSAQDRQFKIVGLNLDDEDTWKKHSSESPVNWNDWNEMKGTRGLSSRINTHGIPTFVIVSAEGTILDIWAGYRNGIITQRMKQKNIL